MQGWAIISENRQQSPGVPEHLSRKAKIEKELAVGKMTDKDTFLARVPKDGKTKGNFTLKNELGWDEEKYWRIRDELVSDGDIALGKGKGGSVFRVAQVSAAVPGAASGKYKAEKTLYKPFLEVVATDFVKDKKLKNVVSQITANQGQKKTGGKWTRPDVVLISVGTYSYLPGKFVDIISFELKIESDFGVSGVFETAAHSRFATKSYYCVHLPQDWNSDNPEYERIKAECERFGVGLIYFTDPEKYDTYAVLVEPDRRSPDPFDMDQFITLQMTESNKIKLSELLH